MTNSGEITCFTFRHVPGKTFSFTENKDNCDFLMKWGMKDTLKIQLFSFDQAFQSYQYKTLINSFFNNPTIISNLEICSANGWSRLGQKASKVDIEIVPCTLLSMEFFDRLKENGVIYESGRLYKCFDEYYENFAISDELRKMLLLEESDNYNLYSPSEKEEFLFCLLKHLCLGGKVCQFEDDFGPYEDMVKKLYKELVCAQKVPDSQQPRIVSSVYKVTAYDEDDTMIYPSDAAHIQTFAYLVVDPLKHYITVLYHCFC
ncbi:cilia- and flagella-associated protein 300-like isoform X2 [Octopus sinensis]|nr:cilia- and flagella-associated protein 300-like isoform X2 [Octopus sinensis]XP_036357482.1 cilia- and flagella-associated protein 300-like isoform X2 [Octopus sinensis]XP_036357483.1 cilia- and flagella-associated protein 300-like isoform X2 [Octopus sinensis]